jgi:hypothetical protein
MTTGSTSIYGRFAALRNAAHPREPRCPPLLAGPYLEGVRVTRGKGYPKLAGELHSLLDIPWDLHFCE